MSITMSKFLISPNFSLYKLKKLPHYSRLYLTLTEYNENLLT